MITFYAVAPQFFFVIAAGALAWAAVSDIRHYIIPNWTSILIATTFAIWAIFMAPSFLISGLLTGVAVLTIGLLVFALNWMGGGDVKLLAAVSLWAGPALLSSFALVTCLAGAALGLFMLSPLRRLMPSPPETAPDCAVAGGRTALRQPMPFGVAIAVGGCYILALRLPFGLSP